MAVALPDKLAKMPKKHALMAMFQEIKRRRDRNKLALYKPYARQREFHARGFTHRERLFRAGNQLGKALHDDTPVLTPTGWMPIGRLSVGDIVIAGDGTPTRVMAVFPQGVKPLHKVTFDSGIEVRCCGEHLWKVLPPAARFKERWSHGKIETNPRFGKWEVMDTDAMIQASGTNPKSRRRFLTPQVQPVQFPAKHVQLDPYLLGLLLGDGSMTGSGVALSTADDEIVAAVAKVLPGYMRISHLSNHDWQISVAPDGKTPRGRNTVINALRHYGLMGCDSASKFIPDDYLFNTPEVRISMLQGLMDTDGSVSKDGAMEFTTVSSSLRDNLMFLVRSLGGKCHFTERRNTYTYCGERRLGQISYRIRIRLPQVQPFRLSRKLERLVRPVSTCDEHVIHSIEQAPEGPATCIAVDHPDHTFVTEGFIVTHNTWSSAYEIAFHLTGLYPDWWEGKRWDRGVTGWALGESMESTRDTMQRLLLGRPKEWGTGTIPGDLIIGEPKRAQGIADSVDCVFVRHISGGISRLYFKSYEKGRSKLQGETLDFAALDEEPPSDIYTEVLTRTNATKGIAWITFTPLLGMSEVVCLFLQNPTRDRADINMTIEDVDHYTPEERQRIIDSYPAHEREARAKGIPILGSGRIFPIEERLISVDPFQPPDLWPRISAMDFGWDHPSATAWLAWDRDTNTVYVYHAIRVREVTPLLQAPAILAQGDWIPMAWPHDGLQHDKGSGFQLAEQYRAAGVNMLYEHAQFPETGAEGGHKISRTSVEAGLSMMLQGFQANDPEVYAKMISRRPDEKPLRIKVFSNLLDWFSEFRLYHRKDGKVVKLQDDLMSATRYGLMMLRFAATPPKPDTNMNPRRDYDWRAG